MRLSSIYSRATFCSYPLCTCSLSVLPGIDRKLEIPLVHTRRLRIPTFRLAASSLGSWIHKVHPSLLRGQDLLVFFAEIRQTGN